MRIGRQGAFRSAPSLRRCSLAVTENSCSRYTNAEEGRKNLRYRGIVEAIGVRYRSRTSSKGSFRQGHHPTSGGLDLCSTGIVPPQVAWLIRQRLDLLN